MDDSSKNFERFLVIVGFILFLFFIYGDDDTRIITLFSIPAIGVILVLFFAFKQKNEKKLNKKFDERYRDVENNYRLALWKYKTDNKISYSFTKVQKQEFITIPNEQWVSWQKEEECRFAAIRAEKRRLILEITKLENDALNGLNHWLEKNSVKALWRESDIDESSGKVQKAIEYVLTHTDEINKYEQNYQQYEADKQWAGGQSEFSSLCIKSIKEGQLHNCGRYWYPIRIKMVDIDGNIIDTFNSIRVWQFFLKSFCLESDLDFSCFPKTLNNTIYINNSFDSEVIPSKPYSDYCYFSYYRFFSQFADSGRRFSLLFCDDEDVVIKDSVYKHHPAITVRSFLIKEMQKRGILCYNLSNVMNNTDLTLEEDVFIIGHVTYTDELIKQCEELVASRSDKRPRIAYFSIFKEFDREEMVNLIEEKQREQELINTIPSKVDSWESLPRGGLKIKYLLDYYPTNLDFEVDDEDWDNRWTVWNFKNDPDKNISEEAHKSAIDDIVPSFSDILKETFGEDALKYLTLVCIPASSSEKNDARYKEFSARLCKETGMENAFQYTQINCDRSSKHEGGVEGLVNYSFDDSFFKGKRVILLDDIITKGNSMRIAKAILEKLGAKVICGLAVGKTRHEPPAITY